MDNDSSSQTLNNFNKSKNLTLEEFQMQIPRKMTIHFLSNKAIDCKEFIEFMTNEKIQNSKELLEINIKKKINLYSFMNYKIYEDAKKLMDVIEDKVESNKKKPKVGIFSEVLIILDNTEIEKQINIIKKAFICNETMQTNSYYIPFLIIISPKKIKLKDFSKSKTFQYRITLENIFNFFKEKKGEKKPEVSAFIRKLNVLFCYYNELGDEFSFINSENKEVIVNIEDDTDITLFVNFLLLGRTGAGKSKLINLLLEEMKSIEGGTGFSTTSKKIIVYKKSGFPIRFYDVKGIENDETSENYDKIMAYFNIMNNISHESINIIFYCIEYKKNGTIIEEMEFKLFQKLINFDIPIFFIITKTPYNPDKPCSKKKTEQSRKNERDIIINAINHLVLSAFNNKNDGKKFIDNYIKIFFVNLVRVEEEIPIPVFGIDKVLSFLSELVPKKDWNELKSTCEKRDEIKCKELLKKNVFLKYYSKFENINLKNQKNAKDYLKGLKAGAFFSGIIPIIDIGMEYLYKYLFQEKLVSLYGFKYNQALEALKKKNIIDEGKDIDQIDKLEIDNVFDEEISSIKEKTNKEIKEKINRAGTEKIGKEEKQIGTEDYEISNFSKNAGSIIRGATEIGGAIIRSLPTAGEITLETGAVVVRQGISAGIKAASWILLPITCLGFATWSIIKIDSDCEKMLNTFEKASFLLIFETLFAYIKSIEKGINEIKNVGQKIIQDDEEEN